MRRGLPDARLRSGSHSRLYAGRSEQFWQAGIDRVVSRIKLQA
jgi:hypothetical protein